jgi:hypothetical protein
MIVKEVKKEEYKEWWLKQLNLFHQAASVFNLVDQSLFSYFL